MIEERTERLVTRDTDFYALAAARRSTRIFSEQPIPKEIVERIISAGMLAPTSCNRQLWHFAVVDDPELKVRICTASNAQQSYIHDAAVLICPFYDITFERNNPCSTSQITVGMSIYAMLLAAEAEGIGAIYLGGIRKPEGIAKVLEAPEQLTSYGFLCLGYRLDDPPAPPKRTLETALSYNSCKDVKAHGYPDLRPHLWTLDQLATFRGHVLWYKGVHIDSQTLHVENDTRESLTTRMITELVGTCIYRYENPTVLDILSFNGDLLWQIVQGCEERVKKVYAYDLHPDVLTYIRERFKELQVSTKVEYLLNLSEQSIRIPLLDDSVEVVVCNQRCEHFHDPTPLLSEIRRVLTEDGRAVVIVRNKFYPHRYRYKRTKSGNYALGSLWDRGPERLFTPREFEGYLKKAGLKVIRRGGIRPAAVKLFSLIKKFAAKRNFPHLEGWAADRLRWGMYRTSPSGTLSCQLLCFEVGVAHD